MSKMIWKYPFNYPKCRIAIPKDGKVVYVDVQRGQPQLWVEVVPRKELVPRIFIAYGTGNLIPNHHKYVGSYQIPPSVWHIHEVIEVDE